METQSKWYAKAWEWIKKYSAVIIGAVATAVGFILGISLGRNNPDIAKLRESNRELVNQIGQFRDRIAELENLNRASVEQCQDLRKQLGIAEHNLERIATDLDGGRADVKDLDEANRSLSDWIQKYRTELEAIERR